MCLEKRVSVRWCVAAKIFCWCTTDLAVRIVLTFHSSYGLLDQRVKVCVFSAVGWEQDFFSLASREESGIFSGFQDWGCVILREIDFQLKICWSIPCLHPSWKVHTWVIGFKTNRGEDKQISFTKKLRGASKHQTSRAKCQHHRSHDTPADVSNLRSWRTRNISKGFVSWEMLLSTHAWNWYESCQEPMDDFTNKLLFDQSKISLTTKIRFKLVLKMSFVKLRSRFGTLMD